MTALEMLKYMHYQICNGGFEQACGNGYVDDLLDEFGTAHKWIKQLKEELDMRTKEGEEAIKAAEMISLAIGDTDLITSCQDCDGEGVYMEDDYEETCEYCNGDGFIAVDSFSEVSFDSDHGFNDWAEEWDSKYYDTIDSDIIDDLTGQSHTHSVVLDMIKKENMNVHEAKRILKENGYRLYR